MTTKQEFVKKVSEIQKTLKAPKSQFNKFGGYNYRNQEDILEAVKPLLGDLILTVNDEVVLVGDRVYVKSTAKITDGQFEVENSAFAREPQDQKGMNEAQITGSASSYARKYSLNGLFLIDDTKDADSDEVSALSKKEAKPSPAKFSRPAKDAPKETSSPEPEVPTEEAIPSVRSFRRSK